MAYMMRSYHPENSRSHQNTELKPDWACLVLTWVTSGESQVTHCFCSVPAGLKCIILRYAIENWDNAHIVIMMGTASFLQHEVCMQSIYTARFTRPSWYRHSLLPSFSRLPPDCHLRASG